MGERAVNGPVAAISPVQQMLASGTGALLTSIFGETMETDQKEQIMPAHLLHTCFTEIKFSPSVVSCM